MRIILNYVNYRVSIDTEISPSEILLFFLRHYYSFHSTTPNVYVHYNYQQIIKRESSCKELLALI